MTSLRAKLFAWMTWTQNINPITHPDAIGKMQRYAKRYLNDRMPKGYTLVKKKTSAGTAYEVIRREDDENGKKTIYYLHGGCYVTGLVSNYHTFLTDCCEIADGTQIVLLDYKLAPEFPYPVQLREALDVWDELTGTQNILPENIVIGGDSSGGNLALALMLHLRDEGKKLPAGAFLLSPWTDLTMSGESYSYNYRKDVELGDRKGVFSKETQQKLLESDLFCFLNDADRTSPYVSPAFGKYHKFPPMFFAVGDHEMLLDDTLAVVSRLKEAGVPVVCECKRGMFHTYVLYKNYMRESRETYGNMKKFIHDLLA